MALPPDFLSDLQVPPALSRRQPISLDGFPPPPVDLPNPPPAPGLPQERVPPEFSGMFGIRGTGRDILGTIGDAFLIQSGNDPRYAPRRQMEREGAAMSGFADNPLAAINRLAEVSPEAAREAYEAYQQQRSVDEYRQARLSESAANRELRERSQREALELRRMLGEALIGYRQERLRDFDADRGVREQQGGQRIELTREDPRRVAPNRTPTSPNDLVGDIMERYTRGEQLNPREFELMRRYQADQERRGDRTSRRPNPVRTTLDNLRTTADYFQHRAETSGGGDQSSGASVIRVQTPQDAEGLEPGTIYETPDGRRFTR